MNKISLHKANIKASFGRLCFCCLFFLLICSGVQAQKLSNYYSSSKQEDGTLYFIEARKNFQTDVENDKFIYDLTYLSTKDSVTVNFTFYNDEIIDVEQLTLQTSFGSTTSPAEKVFVKDKGGDWEHRYTAILSFKDLHEFYSRETVVFIMKTKKHGQIEVHPKGKKWKKQSSVFLRIFDMIVANK